jgi:hypothetical protein
VAEEEVADIPLEERDLLPPGDVHVDVPDRPVRPVADRADRERQRPVAVAPADQLDERRHRVEQALSIVTRGDNAAWLDAHRVRLRPIGDVHVGRARGAAEEDRRRPGRGRLGDREVDEELLGHPPPEQLGREPGVGVAGRDDDGHPVERDLVARQRHLLRKRVHGRGGGGGRGGRWHGGRL